MNNLYEIYPSAIKGIFEALKEQLDKQTWSNENKIHFLAQCAHESMGFKVVKENLNYSAKALLTVFPKYFKNVNVNDYARNQEKIANRVYANRMGNSSESSGDGWKYKGRGLIQITGKANYIAFNHESDPQYLETINGAVESAIWFWNTNKLFNTNDIKTLTKKINGGYNGLEDRIANYNKISKFLKS